MFRTEIQARFQDFIGVTVDGRSATYRYEWFEDYNNCTFDIDGIINCNAEIAAIP